jgi:hypothetical protein
LVAGWLFAFAVAALPARARANDFDQFQNARVAYESLNYELAADLFQGLLRDANPDDRRPLVIESRKYLAATYLFLGRGGEAEAQLELLLRAEPDYVLDPLAFPAAFVKVFEAVKQRLERERKRVAQAHEQAAAADAARQRVGAERQRERMRRLVELASTERVEEVRSRWIAMLPFGIGQFQNDHDGLGLVLAISEALLLGTGIVTFALHEQLPAIPEDRAAATDAEAAYTYINRISLGLFAVVAITGVVDAQVRFQPSRTYNRPRALPPELGRLHLRVGPGAVSVAGRF